MNFGDKTIFYIPSHLGYGMQGAGDLIPANANLIFEIELLEKPTN
jgi:FKBP-type peptidyl-prolyl cis-trans isomerase